VPTIEGEYEEVTSESNEYGMGEIDEGDLSDEDMEELTNMFEGVDLDANDELGEGLEEDDQ